MTAIQVDLQNIKTGGLIVLIRSFSGAALEAEPRAAVFIVSI